MVIRMIYISRQFLKAAGWKIFLQKIARKSLFSNTLLNITYIKSQEHFWWKTNNSTHVLTQKELNLDINMVA